MEEEKILITVEEYKMFLEMSARVKFFEDFANRTKYSVDREDCGRILGFDIKDKEEN